MAVPFSTDGDALLVDAALFKSLIIITGSITAAALMIWLFMIVNGSYTREAGITGTCWLILNGARDALVPGGLIGKAPGDYRPRTGMRYLIIPAMLIAGCVVADTAAVKKNPV